MELTNDFRVGLPVERAWEVLTDVERIAPCLPGAQLQEVQGDDYRGVVKIKVGPITAQYKGQATFVERDEAARRAVLRAEGRETRGQGHASATITATLSPDGDGTAVSIVTDLTITGRVAQFGRGVLADVSAKLLDQFVDCLEKTVLSGDPSAAAGAAAAKPPTPKEPATKRAAAKATRATAKAGTREATAGAAAPAGEQPASAESGDDQPTPVDAPVVTPPPVVRPDDRPAARKVDMPEPRPVDLLEAAGAPVARRVGPVLAVVAVLWLLRKLLSRRR